MGSKEVHNLSASFERLDLDSTKVDHIESLNEKDFIKPTIEKSYFNHIQAWEKESCRETSTMNENKSVIHGFSNSQVQHNWIDIKGATNNMKHNNTISSTALPAAHFVKTLKIPKLPRAPCLTSPHMRTHRRKEAPSHRPISSKQHRGDDHIILRNNSEIPCEMTSKNSKIVQSSLRNTHHRPVSAHSALELQLQEDRPLSRQCITNRYHEDKVTSMEDLRGRLKRRLRIRKKAGITTDPVFQKQMESGFWTAEVLYHQWANNLLGLRQKWQDGSSGCSASQASEDEIVQAPVVQPPKRTNGGRRFAFSNERGNRQGPLSFANIRSLMDIEQQDSDEQEFGDDLAVAKSVAGSSRKDVHGNVKVFDNPLNVADNGTEEKVCPKQHFKNIVKRLMRIIRVMLCMIRSSKEYTVANFMAQVHFLNAMASEEEPSTFRKELFSRNFSKMYVPLWLRKIARKEPYDRTPDDIIRICHVMKSMKSFERFSSRMRMEIGKTARYSCCEKGRVILRQGHVGHNFYFIYSGSVFVQIDIEDKHSGVLTPGTTIVMEKGACFGELALLGSGGKRTASIICRETTELFEIEKETFLEVCPDIFEKELNEKIDAVLKHDFFQEWPKDRLERLCFESRIEEVMYGRVIDSDTSSTDTVYFVLKGKVTILKAFDPSMGYIADKLNTKARLPYTTGDRRCFMKIAELKEGENTELTALRTGDKSENPGVILVSNGVRLMRMSKKKLERFAPRGLVEQFRRRYKPVLEVPEEEELLVNYESDVQWKNVKSSICSTLLKETKGLPIVNTNRNSKGGYGFY